MCEFQCFVDKQLIEIHVFALSYVHGVVIGRCDE